MTLEDQLNQTFLSLYQRSADKIYQAPGRVNIIGEHTDYNDGFVLPAAIDYCNMIAASARDDRVIELTAVNMGLSTSRFHLDEEITADPDASWSNYIRGVVIELKQRGYQLCGANLVITGNVPTGAGLSSSAALEMVTVSCLCDLSGETIDGVQAALVGQAAENNFVGTQCGIMDQLISALGVSERALLIDCRSLETKTYKLPENTSLVIINSAVKRGLVDSEYNVRRQQCEQVARQLNVKALRDVSLTQLESHKDQIDPVAYKRALHVVTENDRTVQAAQAMEAGDMKLLSTLMAQSHISMRDDFEITVPAIDTLVDIIAEVVGQNGGVRMTGGGFGGCVIALVPEALQQQVIEAVTEQYPAKTGLTPEIFICKASQGAFANQA
ncbi:galactokinase [Gynuella sunshinyii]|uniref:Galactokinase n=1 Tax=Gynuella sunshinyii YC6258 TaxID=1445510 RepID=A0A0C5VSQ8_9GAMM|nr:galactokinase [Gynuella sunshinyii]AJQ96373.1 galactokinase [Gynuella sunshinyii YC6258]